MAIRQLQLDFDEALLTPRYLVDPYPYYRALRENDPVHWSPRLNAWVLTRYTDVLAALCDSRLISGQRVASYMTSIPPDVLGELQPLYDQIDKWIGNMDPPDHTRLRRLVNVVFTPRMVESLRPRIEALVSDLLDAIETKRHCNFVTDFAYPLPAIVIAEMLGVPAKDREQFMQWSDAITAYAGTGHADLNIARKASLCAGELTVFFKKLASQRRVDPQDDLITALIELENEGDRLTEREMLSMCGFVLVAGHETTMALLSNGMLALLQHPEQLERLRDEPGLITPAVEELLRYDSPIQHQTRVAVEDLELGDRKISRGDRVLPFLGAANRDPAEFTDPDCLDLSRNPNKHLAFGYGLHFCVGAPLARLEGQIAFSMILDRFADLRLENRDIEFRVHTSQRNPVALPVRV